MNLVQLRGRFTKKPETSYSKDGTCVVSVCLAVPDRLAKKDEKGNYPADFIRLAAFGKEAEVLDAFGEKGTEVLVTGRLRSGRYEKDGQTHFTTEVHVTYFEFLSSTKKTEKEEQPKAG